MALKPYQQGGLDSLCGIYAIINAFRWGICDLASLNKDSCKHLNLEMSEYLEDAGLLSSAIKYGLTAPELSRLIKVSSKCICKEKGITLTTRKPFHSKRSVTLRTLSCELKKHFSTPNTTAIIVTAGRLDHWTAVTGINQRSITLLDSVGLRRFNLTGCICTPNIKDHQQTLRIIPSSVFLLKFYPAK